MERRIKYVYKTKNNSWYYAVQVKRWLFWKTIYTDSIFTNVQKFIDTLAQIDEFNTKSLSKVILDGWAVKNVYKDTGPDYFINFYQSYPIRQENYNHNVILWGDSNGGLLPTMQIKTARLFGKECIEQPMKLRITIEQIGE
jgi:hypothetical protein